MSGSGSHYAGGPERGGRSEAPGRPGVPTRRRRVTGSIAASVLAALPLAAPALAQEPGRAADGSIDNLTHPPGSETVHVGTLGAVVRRGHGPVPLLLIAAAPYGADAWAGFMERNEDRYTMWAVTQPGYAGTRPPPMPSWESLEETPWLDGVQDALVRLIEDEDMERPVVIGHQLEGDYHALRLGLEHPELVSGVVVLAGAPGRPVPITDGTGTTRAARPEERLAALRDRWIPFYRTVTSETWRQGTTQAAGLSRDSDHGAALFERKTRTPIPTQIRYFIEMLSTNLPPRLPAMRVPVLAINLRLTESLGEHFDRGERRILALPEFRGMDPEEGRAAYIASRIERFGSEAAALRAIYGSNWLEMPTPPADLEVEVVGPSGVFVMDDRGEDVDRILEGWIGRKVLPASAIGAEANPPHE